VEFNPDSNPHNMKRFIFFIFFLQKYDWDGKVQGYILSSFYWGYITTQIPAGVLTDRFGAYRFLYVAILASSFLSVILPQCAYWGGWQLVCGNRVLQGVSQVKLKFRKHCRPALLFQVLISGHIFYRGLYFPRFSLY